MIKSCIAILLIFCMMLTLTGCNDSGNEQNKSSETDSTTTTTVQESSNENEPPKSDTEEYTTLYSEVEAFLDRTILINYHADKFRDANGLVTMYSDMNEYLTATVFDDPANYSGNLSETLDYLMTIFVNQASYDVPGMISDYPFRMTESEQTTVNGFDAMRFSGTINNSVWDYNIYGYSFLINGAPVMVVGMVYSEAQEQELIDMMIEEVDAMAATIRTEE